MQLFAASSGYPVRRAKSAIPSGCGEVLMLLQEGRRCIPSVSVRRTPHCRWWRGGGENRGTEVQRCRTAGGVQRGSAKCARPVLRRIRDYLREQEKRHLPKSPFGQAIGYAQRNRAALERYTSHGALEIDNNGAERAIKPLLLGRKNWLFIGSEAAAHRNAVLLTLVNSAKAHGIDPFVYLRDLIERVSTHPASRIAELTPRCWKALRTPAASLLAPRAFAPGILAPPTQSCGSSHAYGKSDFCQRAAA